MEDFEAKWRTDCDKLRDDMKETLRKTKTVSDYDRTKVSLIGGLRPYIDFYRKDRGYPPEEPLYFYDGKAVINLAIWEHGEKLKQYERSNRSDKINEVRQNIRILEQYRDSF
jgi:uncharacterized protein YqeY